MKAVPRGTGAPEFLPPSGAPQPFTLVAALSLLSGQQSRLAVPEKLPFLLCVVAVIRRKKQGASSRFFPSAEAFSSLCWSAFPRKSCKKPDLALEGEHLRNKGLMMSEPIQAGAVPPRLREISSPCSMWPSRAGGLEKKAVESTGAVTEWLFPAQLQWVPHSFPQEQLAPEPLPSCRRRKQEFSQL